MGKVFEGCCAIADISIIFNILHHLTLITKDLQQSQGRNSLRHNNLRINHLV